jgi:glycosyltransferase involved in cell wall biosynthesis
MSEHGSPKKIALCLEHPLGLRGGVSVLVETLLLGLREHYDLILVSPDTPESLRDSYAAPFIGKHLAWNPEKVSRQTSRQLAKELAQSGASVAHFHFSGNFGWGNRFLGRCPIPYLDRMGIPVCSTIHLMGGLLDGFCGPQKPLWFKLALFPAAWLGKMHVLRHVRREIAVSQDDCRKLQRWYRPLRRKFGHIYHSRLKESAKAQNERERENNILYVGHIAARKGQLFLAEAFARVAARFPAWNLLLIGGAVEMEWLSRLQEFVKRSSLTGRIQLLGSRPDAMNYMQSAAIFVQPSRLEGLPLALQEAMFSGCACIGTNISGNNEIITHEENGLLVSPGNVDDLAHALERLVLDADLRQSLGRKGALSIAKKGMTSEAMLKRHLELYHSILCPN